MKQFFPNNHISRNALLCENFKIEDLNDALSKTKGTTPSIDRITYSMIKNSPPALKKRLLQLYNNILHSGTYPHDWKTALLAPIPKPGKNPNNVDGYRPISLIPVLSKIFEKLIATRFWKQTNKKISEIQHAFLPKHGVHSICHQLESSLRYNLSNRKHNVILSEDIEKAFDRVVSTFVLDELREWDIPFQMIKLIYSFLSNRMIIVKVDGYFSQLYPLDNGVPQGSPLSVVLFTIYVNSLARFIKNSPGVDYVGIYDDNIFAVASGSPAEVSANLNILNNKIQNWASTRGAVIPENKSELLHVCKP